MNQKLVTRKQELKELAKKIRELKEQRKPMRGYVPGLYSAQESYRYKHIAYCMARGKEYEEIEQKVSLENFIHEFLGMIEITVEHFKARFDDPL